MTKSTFLILICFLSALYSCQKSCERNDGSVATKPLVIIRFEDSLFSEKTPKEMASLLKKHSLFSDKYFQRNAFPHDSLLANYLFNFYSNKELKKLKNETQKEFGDLKTLRGSLENFFGHVKYYYPSFIIPPVYTLVSGFQFEKDIIVSDSLIAISLDYFLGPKATYRPPFYNYFLERYEKQYVVPMISLAVSGKYNKINEKDDTMLASMIYYGKAFYFTKAMLPCLEDSLVIQYSGKQLKDINKNTDLIWGHFIEKKLLFETKPQIIEKYVGESPRVNEIGENCPGRIGRWLGWEIVKKYMIENTQVTLQQLMEEKDAGKIFKLSKYKPK